jgi:hypothetical protein
VEDRCGGSLEQLLPATVDARVQLDKFVHVKPRAGLATR